MLDIRPVLLVIGVLLTVLAAAMLVPAVFDLWVKSRDWQAFVMASGATLFFGVLLILTNRCEAHENLSLRQAFILTSLSWFVLVLFASLPFRLSALDVSWTDAIFESMSGLTTTGATVFVGLDTMPPGILLWRALLQWLGGIGIIVMAMALLPLLRIGGMQLFRTESSDKSEKALPRMRQIAAAISGFYVFLTFLVFAGLWYAGMTAFDALCHAMTTVSTGGLSTHDVSIGYYDNVQIEMVLIIGMLMSAIPFALYVRCVNNISLRSLMRDSQVRWFFSIALLAVAVMTIWLWGTHEAEGWSAFRISAFNVVSVITTSGFSTSDYSNWGAFAVVFMFLLAVVGGCTGSTTGGIKIFRFQVLIQTVRVQLGQLVQPHGVYRAQYNGQIVSEQATASVMSFVILFAFTFCTLALVLGLTGLDFLSAMSAAAAMVANLGPGLGDLVGPSGNYVAVSDFAKWVLSAGMLIGRLEIFTVLILFSPYFWRD